ncbi:hypothetical protein [Aquimarina mytili]|uniref:Uncharacterized protein n=1 Tax=Aquimarina mytili TaxID=874423 RepID=A0A936ZYU1_9FLAO|nr:hypothetical protein [Aquimarina mytili]MBL0684846.1 hypothetical protein [Aquimarina mytili]
MKSSKAYNALDKYVSKNVDFKAELGNIEDICVLPISSYSSRSDSSGNYGNATLNIILKGDKKYKRATAYLIKEPDSLRWRVVRIEKE